MGSYIQNVQAKQNLENILRDEEKSTKINSININDDKAEILLVSDEHMGTKNYERDFHLKVLENAYNKGWYILHLGDGIEAATRNSIGAGVYDQLEILDKQVSEWVSVYEPFVKANKFLGAHLGNHEARAYKDDGINLMRHMCREINGKYLGIGKAHIIKVGNQTYTMYTTHGSSNATLPYTKIKGALDMEKIIDSEIYAMGHCFDDQTEILTKDNGWIKGINLTKEDIVGTINQENLQFEWNNIIELIEAPKNTQLLKLNTKTNDLIITDEHRLFLLNADGTKVTKTIKDLLQNKSQYNIFNCGLSNKNIQTLDFNENELRLLINIVADGSIEKNIIQWHLKKQRKIDHLENLFLKLGYKYSKYYMTAGTVKLNLNKVDSEKYINMFENKIKKLPKFIINLKPELVNIVLNEYSITDGCRNKIAIEAYQISSSKEEEIDILQEMFIRNGYRATKTKRLKGNFILTVNSRIKTCFTGLNNIKVGGLSNKTWCVKVLNDTVIVRRNGKVSVTHNCHQLSHHVRNFNYIDQKKKQIETKQKHFILTGTYLSFWDSYAQIKNMEPSRMGSPRLYLDGKEHQIKVILQ
jgi:hypothetical protein